MRTLDKVLTEQKRTHTQALAESAAAAIAPARISSRAAPRNARDPLNQFDPNNPDRDPRDIALQGTIAPQTVTPEQQKILDVLPPELAARFRKEKGLPPV